MNIDKGTDDDSDDVSCTNVGEEGIALDVADSEHGENAVVRGILDVVDDIDGNENASTNSSDGRKDPAHHAKKA